MPRPSKPFYVKAEKRWRCTINGKKYSRKTQREIYELYTAALGHDPDMPLVAKPVTIADLSVIWTSEVRPSKHGSEMANEFVREFGAERIAALPPDIMQRYKRHLEARPDRLRRRKTSDRKQMSRETVRKKIRYAATLLRFGAKRFGFEMPDVPKTPKPPPRPKALSDKQVRELLASMNGARAKFARHVVRFMLEVGCRPSETLKLKWSQIDLERNVAILEQHKTDADGDARILYLSDRAVRIIQAQRGRHEQYVFVSGLKEPFTVDGFASMLRRHGASPYQLRHTWCQRAADAGIAEEVISRMMGHADSSMVRMYRRISDQRVRTALDKLRLARPSPPDAPASESA